MTKVKDMFSLTEARSKKPVVEGLRDPVYESGDSIIRLEDLASDRPLRGDRKYESLVQKLDRAHRELRAHLDSNYTWD